MSTQGLDTVMNRVEATFKDRVKVGMAAVAAESRDRIKETLNVAPYRFPRDQDFPYRRKGYLRDGISHEQSEPNNHTIRETIISTRVEGDPDVPRWVEEGNKQNAPPHPYMRPEKNRLEKELLPNFAGKVQLGK